MVRIKVIRNPNKSFGRMLFIACGSIAPTLLATDYKDPSLMVSIYE